MARSPARVPTLLLSALLHLILLRATTALITISEIKGRYVLRQANLNVCEDTAEISSSRSTLVARSLSFGGKPCRLGRFPLKESSIWRKKGITSEKIGIHVFGASPELSCQQIDMFNVTLVFMRPIADVKLRGRGFRDFYTFRKGMQYFFITAGKGSCYYKLASSDPSPAPTNPNPNNGSSATGVTDAKEKEKGSGLNMWVWLGPIIGAVATIIGAIITIIKCRDSNSSSGIGAITINNNKP